MENPSHVENTVSLHLYVPPYQECKIFDQRTGVTQVCPVTFHTKYGRKLDYRGCKQGRISRRSPVSDKSDAQMTADPCAGSQAGCSSSSSTISALPMSS